MSDEAINAAYRRACRNGNEPLKAFLEPGLTNMSSIGDKPASEMTYREWLIGQALSSAMTMLEVRLLQNIGRHCVEYADSVLSILDGQHPEGWVDVGIDMSKCRTTVVTPDGCFALPRDEEHPNRIPLDFTAVKTDGVTDASGDDLPPGGGFVPTKADR